jgi:ABC-type multidrug transport system fused ATPase/permease subunit
MSFEVIGIYLLVSFRLMPVINALILLIQKKKNRVGSMEIVKSRINEMISEKELDIGKSDLNLALSSIRFNSVSYKYPSRNDNALSRVSFSLPINHMTAIVGPSGGGKSTLIDLLPRLRTPTEGFIEINGNNIEKYRLTDLRKLISYATQNQQIFDGTIKEHILYGKYNATDKEVRGAVKLSGAEEFIEQLPQGLDTNIGGDTIKLSGGQIQRLDLARVLIRKSPILILDEPTSNLDLESESEFKKVLGEIRKKKDTTIIAVSHKLSNIVDADQIIVINKGKIDDIGSHSQLLSREGWYSRAWNLKN